MAHNLAIYIVISSIIEPVLAADHFRKRPQNAAGISGSNITLHCQVHQEDFVSWSKFKGSTSRPISRNSNLTLDTMGYTINSTVKGQYDLGIPLANDTAGRYQCLDWASSQGAYAHVTVLDPTICNDTVMVEGDIVTLTCFVNYITSSIDWPPSITWTGPDGIISDVIDESTPGHVKVSIELVGSPVLDGARVTALTHFLSYDGSLPSHHATNIPSYRETQLFGPFSVLYPPRNITFNPVKASYISGDSITCSSDGNPAVRYRWYDITDNTTVSAGAMVTILNTMVGDVTLACEAYNVIRGNVMANSRLIYISTSTTSVTVPIVVGTLGASVVMTISIIIICRKLHSSQCTAERGKKMSSHNEPCPAAEATNEATAVHPFHDISDQHQDDGSVDITPLYENIDLQESVIGGNATYSNLVPTTHEPARSTEYEVLQH